MLIMLGVTFTALILKMIELVNSFSAGVQPGNVLQLVFAVLLFILGLIVAVEGIRKLIKKDNADVSAPASGKTAAV